MEALPFQGARPCRHPRRKYPREMVLPMARNGLHDLSQGENVELSHRGSGCMDSAQVATHVRGCHEAEHGKRRSHCRWARASHLSLPCAVGNAQLWQEARAIVIIVAPQLLMGLIPEEWTVEKAPWIRRIERIRVV